MKLTNAYLKGRLSIISTRYKEILSKELDGDCTGNLACSGSTGWPGPLARPWLWELVIGISSSWAKSPP